MKKTKIDANLITSPVWGVYNKVPIWIVDVVESDLYPIKFKYKFRGYGNLIFSDLKRNIEII